MINRHQIFSWYQKQYRGAKNSCDALFFSGRPKVEDEFKKGELLAGLTTWVLGGFVLWVLFFVANLIKWHAINVLKGYIACRSKLSIRLGYVLRRVVDWLLNRSFMQFLKRKLNPLLKRPFVQWLLRETQDKHLPVPVQSNEITIVFALLEFVIGAFFALVFGFIGATLQCLLYGVVWGFIYAYGGPLTGQEWRTALPAQGDMPLLGILGLIPGFLVGVVLGGFVLTTLQCLLEGCLSGLMMAGVISQEQVWNLRIDNEAYMKSDLGGDVAKLAGLGLVLGLVLVAWPYHMWVSCKIYFKQAHYFFSDNPNPVGDLGHNPQQSFGWSMDWVADPRTEFKVKGMPLAAILTFFAVGPAWVVGALTGWLRVNAQAFILVGAAVLKRWPYASTDRELAHWGDAKRYPVRTAILASPGMLLGVLAGGVSLCLMFLAVCTGLYDALWLSAYGLQFGLDRDWMRRGPGTYWRACLNERSWPLRIPGLLVGTIVGGLLALVLSGLRATKHLCLMLIRLVRFAVGAFYSLFTSAPPLVAGKLTDHFDWRGRLHAKPVSSDDQRAATRWRRALFHLNPVGESVAEQAAVYVSRLISPVDCDGGVKGVMPVSDISPAAVVQALTLADPWVTSRYERAYVACEVQRVLHAFQAMHEPGLEVCGESLSYGTFFNRCLWATGEDESQAPVSPSFVSSYL